MRGNAPWGVKGINGLRAFGAWHFCASAKMPNVSIAVYVPPGRCPGLGAAIGLTARHTCAANAVKSFAYMNDFVKPKDQREFIRFGLARNRTFKKD